MNNVKEKVLEIFCYIQKTIRGFARLANQWKYKKSKVKITTSLSTSEELNIFDKNTFVLYENGNLFLFVISELTKIIVGAISNTTNNLFSNPLIIKNPYTNHSFLKSDLYNIYFQLLFNQQKIPELFRLFFTTNFDIYEFTEKYEHIIREYAIKYYYCRDY
jgi:hypothetical protein